MMKRFLFLTAILTLLLASSAMGYEQFEGKKITLFGGPSTTGGEDGYAYSGNFGVLVGADLEYPMPEDHFSYVVSTHLSFERFDRFPFGIPGQHCIRDGSDKYSAVYTDLSLLAGFKVNTRFVYFSAQAGFNFQNISDYQKTDFRTDEYTGGVTRIEEIVEYHISVAFGYAGSLGFNLTETLRLGLNGKVFPEYHVDSDYKKITYQPDGNIIRENYEGGSSHSSVYIALTLGYSF
jgi:hypothetical protein